MAPSTQRNSASDMSVTPQMPDVLVTSAGHYARCFDHLTLIPQPYGAEARMVKIIAGMATVQPYVASVNSPPQYIVLYAQGRQIQEKTRAERLCPSAPKETNGFVFWVHTISTRGERRRLISGRGFCSKGGQAFSSAGPMAT